MSYNYTPHKSKKRKIRRMLKLYFRQRHLMIKQLRKNKQEVRTRPIPNIEPLQDLMNY